MNPYVAAIMASTAVAYIGLLIFALLSDLPWLLTLLALLAVGRDARRTHQGASGCNSDLTSIHHYGPLDWGPQC